MNIQCYGVLISSENSLEKISSEEMYRSIRRNKGYVLLDGFDKNRFAFCAIFRKRLNRERFKCLLDKQGILYTSTDDCLIDEKYVR